MFIPSMKKIEILFLWKRMLTCINKMPLNWDDSIWSLVSDEELDYDDWSDIGAEDHGFIGSYHPSFPNEWLPHAEDTGPEQCGNCAIYGTYNGQFIGYCANCADNVYHGTRGRGFVDVCTENDAEEARQWVSVFDTYLHAFEHAVIPGAYDESVAIVSDDEEDEDFGGPELVGENTVFEGHYEGGYADFYHRLPIERKAEA